MLSNSPTKENLDLNLLFFFFFLILLLTLNPSLSLFIYIYIYIGVTSKKIFINKLNQLGIQHPAQIVDLLPIHYTHTQMILKIAIK